MFKNMEPQGIFNIRQGSNSKINGYIPNYISIVHIAHPLFKEHG